MRTAQFVAAALVSSILLLAAPGPVLAICAAVPAETLYHRAHAIFYGQPVAQSHPPYGGTHVTFQVGRVLKGRLGPKVTVWQESGPTGQGTFMSVSTDVGFEMDQSYLVFLRRFQGRLLSNQCDGTRRLPALGAEELGAVGLGELARHLPGDRPELGLPDPGAPDARPVAGAFVRGDISFAVFAALGLIGAGVVGYLWWWSRRNPTPPG